MKSRSILMILGGVAAVAACCICLIAVGIVAWQMDLLSFLTRGQAAPRLVPADTSLYISFNPTVQDLAGFRHLEEIYGDIRQVEDLVEEVEDMAEDADISFEEDVRPWVGTEIAVAILNLDVALEYPYERLEIVLLAQTRDRTASDAFLERVLDLLEDAGSEVEEETHEGVSFYIASRPGWDLLVFGTVEGFVVITVDPGTMEDVIDLAQGDGDSLAEDERHRQAMAALPADAVAYMFIDATAAIESAFPGLYFELPGHLDDDLETLRVYVALGLDREGIRIDGALVFDPEETSADLAGWMQFQARASAGRVLERIPDDAMAFTCGQNLHATWAYLLAVLRAAPDVDEQLEDIEDEVGLRVDEDLLSWQTEEFCLVIVELDGDDPPNAFAVLEVEDQRAAAATMEDLFDTLLFGDLAEEEIGGVAMQVLLEYYTDEIVWGYGFTDGYLVVGVSEDGLEAAVDRGITPISEDEAFRAVRSHLPRQTAGISYVDVESVLDIVRSRMLPYERGVFEEEVLPFLEPIRAFGAARPAVDRDSGVIHTAMFIYIP